MASAGKRIEDARQAQAQALLQKSDIERGLVRWRQDEERLKLALATCREETAQCEGRVKQQTQLASDTRLLVESLKEAEDENKNNIETWQTELQQAQTEREEQDKKVTDLRIRQNDFHHRLENAVADHSRQHEESKNIEDQWQVLQTETAAVDGQRVNTEKELRNASLDRDELFGKADQYQAFRNELYAEKTRLLSDTQKLDRALRDLKRRIHELEESLHAVRLDFTKYEFELKYCQEQIEGQYNISVEEASRNRLDLPVAEIEKQARQCEQEIQEIGPVNPTAVEEYRRAADRFDFMTSQADDLSKAAEALRQIIADIDRTMAEKFEVGFAAINGHFSDIFVRLFGGGSATLELSAADNILEAGVEIFVQPPGKRRQNLALLSGGERALTVISILFSFLAYRPAPFCVVDEIDSALDESNVRRFSEFLTEYSKKSQFIVVTHRKGTMEAADILHGVTMEDSGVSRLVSVKFLEDGKEREEGRMMSGAS